MADVSAATRHMPRLHVNTGEILGHAANAQAAACGECDESIANLIGDAAALVAEITWLYTELRNARLRAANLEAAILAALHAWKDGDDDPYRYLLDEIVPGTGGAYGA